MNNRMKILIAYDGVNPVEKKIDDLKRAGLPKDVEVKVMTTVDAFMPSTIGYSELSLPASSVAYMEAEREAACERIEKELERAKSKVELIAKRFQQVFPKWAVHSEAFIDSPTEGIIKKEDEWKPNLIVVGSHGGSVVARFFLGSVARSVLIHSKCSVRIVRKHRKTKQPIRILIGMDGSADSQFAVQAVAKRSWSKGTSVRLVTAFDQKMASAIAFHQLPIAAKRFNPKGEGEEAWVRQMTSPFTEKLEAAGLKVSDTIKAGKPWKVLVEEAESWKADCIFIGARGLGKLDRFLLGSVSNAVASRAHCSVEVVREGF